MFKVCRLSVMFTLFDFPLLDRLVLDLVFLFALLQNVAILFHLCFLAACVLGVSKLDLVFCVAVDTVQQVAHVGIDCDDGIVFQSWIVTHARRQCRFHRKACSAVFFSQARLYL